eukprot:5004454-Pleurochrysis_carterae.AAC.4
MAVMVIVMMMVIVTMVAMVLLLEAIPFRCPAANAKQRTHSKRSASHGSSPTRQELARDHSKSEKAGSMNGKMISQDKLGDGHLQKHD